MLEKCYKAKDTVLKEHLSLVSLPSLKRDCITRMSGFVEDNQASTPELIRKTVSTQC